jgi:hypothetical protein
MNVSTQAHNTAVLGDCGRLKITSHTKVKALKFWLRLINMPSSRYAKMAYERELGDLQMGKSNCASTVRDTLRQTGFYYVWLNQGVESEGSFISEFAQRVNDNYRQEWFVQISTTLSYYKLIQNQV